MPGSSKDNYLHSISREVLMNEIRTLWKKSKIFRALLVAALIYTFLRIAVQAVLLVDMTSASVSAPEGQVASDLQIYATAAHRFLAHEDMYLESSLPHPELQFLYSPAFALTFMPIWLLPMPVLIPLSALFHIAVYALMYFWWGKMFKRLQLVGASQALTKLLPVWLVFSAFWDDMAYLNIYILMALVATFFIDAVLEEKLGWAIFWLGVIILPIKPQWAFAAALPLLLGRNKFFFRLVIGAVIAYLLVAGTTILVGGVNYGFQQYSDYFAFLARLSRDYAWRGPDSPFLGYNHSIIQIIYYFFGVSPVTLKIATLVKIILLVPLGWVAVKYLTHPLNKRGDEVPHIALDFGFALYLGAFLWLDMVWELSLGIAIFTYLIGTLENKKVTTFLWVIFLPYALVDIWRLLSYLIFGDAVLYEGAYVLTDPLTYLPWIMMVLLTFYAIFIARLWKSPKQLTP
jgi:hypothetical protein